MSYTWTTSDDIAEDIRDEDVETLENDFEAHLRSMLPRVPRRSAQTDTTITYDPVSGKRPARPSRQPIKRHRILANSSVNEHVQPDDLYNVQNDIDLSSSLDVNYEEQTAGIPSYDELQAMVDALANELEVVGRNLMPRGEWSERVEHVEENWERSRPELFKYVTMSAGLPTIHDCMHCGVKDGVIRCWQCGPAYLLCPTCDVQIHTTYVLHNRDVWNGHFFKPIPPNDIIDERTSQVFSAERLIPLSLPKICPTCQAFGKMERCKNGEKKRIVVTLSGRYDLMDATIVCNECDTEFLTEFSPCGDLIREGYWPGGTTGRSSYVFDQDLFRFFHLLRLHNPGISYSGFIKTLEQMSLMKGRAPTINPVVFSKAFSEWKYCNFELKKMTKTPLLECPACYQGQHSVHIDGNRKLYRFSKVPRGTRKSYYEGQFIAKNEAVDHHLNTIGYDADNSSNDNLCGSTRWKAAKTKSKTMANLDETGLSVGGCRHVIAQKAVNMFRGEIHGYTHYLHTRIFGPSGVRHIWVDVICKYWPWARNKQSLFDMGDMKACLPVMHAKAHSWHCQILWGGRWQDGAAGGSGEDMEQLFSYLSRWGFPTKYLTAANREDTITEAVMFWNSLKIEKMPLQLKRRYLKTQEMVRKLTDELKEMQQEFTEELTSDVLCQYKSNICQIAQDEICGSASFESLSSDAKYYLLYKQTETSHSLQGYVNNTDMLVNIAIESTDLYKKARELTRSAAQKQQQLLTMEQQFNFGSFEERHDVLAHGKQEVLTTTMNKLRGKIEMLYLTIIRRQDGIQKESTTSKQRTSLRRAIASDKKKIAEYIIQYNAVLTDLDLTENSLSSEEVMEGKFPWSAITGMRNSISTQLQLEVVDIYMKLCRYKEEESQLVHEMMSFLAYFKDVVLTGLNISLTETRELLTTDSSHDDEQASDDSAPIGKYAVCTTDPLYLRGKASLLEQGIAQCKAVLCYALGMFGGTSLSEVYDYEAENTINGRIDTSDIENDSDTDYDDYNDNM
ncbi:uncharacterized protein [Dysidea avara]|uniref:uncharacterized protein isoform X2 n=1 Tax=Dysidea avara TaxID=196820 RepID=UPI003322E483